MAAPTARPTIPRADAHAPHHAHLPTPHLCMKAATASTVARGRPRAGPSMLLFTALPVRRPWVGPNRLVPTALGGTTTAAAAVSISSSSTRAAARKTRRAILYSTSGPSAVSMAKVAIISIVCSARAMTRSMCRGMAMIRFMRRGNGWSSHYVQAPGHYSYCEAQNGHCAQNVQQQQ